jgi:hypothetical protein
LLGSVAEGTVAIASVLIGAVLRSSPWAIVVLSNAIGVESELGP